jgi:uncharacterized protein (TIGR04255 family)
MPNRGNPRRLQSRAIGSYLSRDFPQYPDCRHPRRPRGRWRRVHRRGRRRAGGDAAEGDVAKAPRLPWAGGIFAGACIRLESRHIIGPRHGLSIAGRRALRGVNMTAVAGDPFPPAPRVFYRKAPLVQVTCQVRFPTILRVEDRPADFQERVRKILPLVERPVHVPLPPQLPPEIAQTFRAQLGFAGWRFLTDDKTTTLGLSSDSLVLSTTKYTTWGDFLIQWRPGLSALVDIYSPDHFSRVSLRYQDFILREDIGLGSTPWSELLRKELLGEIAVPQIERYVEDASRMLRVRLPADDSTMVLQHGIGKQEGDNRVGYLIDLDFAATARTETHNVEPTLAKLHGNVWRAFRWCITRKLHEALEPDEFSDNVS